MLIILTNYQTPQDVSKEITVKLEPYKSVTNGAFFQVITLKSNNCYVEYLDGFDFEWGYTYQIKLKETHLKNPPADGSSISYELIEVISKTKVPESYQFNLLITRDLYLGPGNEQTNNLQFINDSTYRYMDEINIIYDHSQEHFFDKVLSDNQSKKGTFIFIDTQHIRLLQ
jgi:hypothetical protein